MTEFIKQHQSLIIKCFALVVVVLLILLFTISVVNRTYENKLLTGFWRGDVEFCKEANLDLFLLYIADDTITSSDRNAYLIVKNDEGLIINEPVEMNFTKGISLAPYAQSHRSYTVNFDWHDEIKNKYPFFPNVQQMHYYPLAGKIVLSNEETVYAILYKDPVISDVNKDVGDDLDEAE